LSSQKVTKKDLTKRTHSAFGFAQTAFCLKGMLCFRLRTHHFNQHELSDLSLIIPNALAQRLTPMAGRVMIIFGFSLVCVSGRVDLGNLVTPHGI